MNVLKTSEDQDFSQAKKEKLLGCGLQDLREFARSSAALSDALEALKSLGDDDTVRRAERLSRQLESFEPSVTMIGQIKSGKTSLVNALIGEPDLLPADVNPWTSVVTSLHLHPLQTGFQNSASFRFFDRDEWDRLVSGGGRIGELASRAGADDELEKIKQQVAEMREKSRARLGRKFEVLLGQQRDYGYFDKDLIERYVCLGEDPDEEEVASGADGQGRFADITKSADLIMQRAALSMRLCIRDTPGVNDTFMMREQITIRAIRDSRICVVVLSAHQALTTTDMALIRLISNVKSRDVIIFVNRIDELSDPAVEVPQIRQSIYDTLRKHNGPGQVEVICGSALWASFALQGRLERLPAGSLAALRNWFQFKFGEGGHAPHDLHLDEMEVWQLSGLPDLQATIATRVVNGMGAAHLQRIGASAHNLLGGIAAADRLGTGGNFKQPDRAMDREIAHNAMREIVARHSAAMAAEFDNILSAFAGRMERVQESFLERATASLVVHLESYGELSPWTYDPAGLRALLNASHKVLARKSQAAFEAATKAAADEVSEIYARVFSVGPRELQISLPRAPQVPAPVSLGRTIALDLNGSWWKRWWLQRRGYKAYAQSFHDLIKSETNPMIAELRDDLAQGVRDEACTNFEAFLNELLSVFETLDRMQQAGSDEIQAFVAGKSAAEQRDLMERTLKTLNGFALS